MRGPDRFALAGLSTAVLIVVLLGLFRTYGSLLFPAPDGIANVELLDLRAQQGMAAAAWGMLAITVVSLGVAIATLLLIRENLKEARAVTREAARSAKAAEDAVAVTQAGAAETINMAKKQVRAYLAVTAVEVSVERGIAVSIANSGQSPARVVRLSAQLDIETTAEFIPRDTDWNPASAGPLRRRFLGDFPAGAAGVHTVKYFHYGSDYDGAQAIRLTVHGEVAYEDVFQNYHQERFIYRATSLHEAGDEIPFGGSLLLNRVPRRGSEAADPPDIAAGLEPEPPR